MPKSGPLKHLFLARSHRWEIRFECRRGYPRALHLRPIPFLPMNFPDPSLPPILIVDDCDDDIFLLRYRLREAGVANSVITFGSPGGALEFLRYRPADAAKPGIIFTDIRMPEPGGFHLIAQLREDPEWDSVRLVVVTSSNHPRDLERALELGINGYLIKFPPADLLGEFVRSGPWFAKPARSTSFSHPLSA